MSELNDHTPHDLCPYWLAGFLDAPLRRRLHDPLKIFTGLVSAGQTVVDLGCGPGYFSLGLAELVGEKGCVLAVDLQPQMLARLRSQAEKRGLSSRIVLHLCNPGSLGLDRPVDFGLAFWMLHEVPDPTRFLSEVYAAIKPGGRFLLVEPWIHVSKKAFQGSLERIVKIGFNPIAQPEIRLSRSVLFQK